MNEFQVPVQLGIANLVSNWQVLLVIQKLSVVFRESSSPWLLEFSTRSLAIEMGSFEVFHRNWPLNCNMDNFLVMLLSDSGDS